MQQGFRQLPGILNFDIRSMKTVLFKFYLAALFIVITTTSCTKVIDLKLQNDTNKLVIEGNITNVLGAQSIKLSQNVPFTNANDYPPVSGAKVTISDQAGNSYPLIEKLAGTYLLGRLAGIAGNTYTMTVLTNGKTYTANSVLPKAVVLDSITTKNDEFNSKNKNILVHFKDPAQIKNHYRFVLYVNGTQVSNIFAYNDDFTDGRYINTELRNNVDIYPGDQVTVEMQCIDEPVYTYWYTLMQQQVNGPGGGVTPSNPPSNIAPVALGYFSAHTTQSITIMVK